MIYIINNNNNTIVTESWLSYSPQNIIIYFDDIEIGEVVNVSEVPTYLKLTIPKELLLTNKIKEKQYSLKIYKDYALFKVELLTVLSENELKLYEKNTTHNNIIKNYE